MWMSWAAWLTALTARPNATPGRRLDVSVAAGNWDWCEISSGPTLPESILTSDESGTEPPVSGDLT